MRHLTNHLPSPSPLLLQGLKATTGKEWDRINVSWSYVSCGSSSDSSRKKKKKNKNRRNRRRSNGRKLSAADDN